MNRSILLGFTQLEDRMCLDGSTTVGVILPPPPPPPPPGGVLPGPILIGMGNTTGTVTVKA